MEWTHGDGISYGHYIAHKCRGSMLEGWEVHVSPNLGRLSDSGKITCFSWFRLGIVLKLVVVSRCS